jgi:two-component system, sensor histidine kinase and response regulator
MIRSRLIIALAGLTALLGLGLGYFLWDGYQRAERAAEVSVRNAAATLEARIDGLLRHVEFLLEDIVEENLPPDSHSARAVPKYAAKINASLARHRAHAPEVVAIGVFDANGDELYRSQREPLPNVAGRDYFKSLSANPRARLHFSEVFTGAVLRVPVMVVSKPIADTTGRLRAIVAVALDLSQIQKLFAAVDFDKRGLIGLRRMEDGRLVLRWPEVAGAVNQPVQTPIENSIRAGSHEGVVRFAARTDGIERLFAFRTIGDYPFRIGAAVAVDDYLADWRRGAAISIAAAVLVLAGFAFMARRIESELRRRKASEDRFRALTALSSDWYWEQDADFRLTLMSSDMQERTGFAAADYLGMKRWDRPALNLTEEDWARHRALLERHEPFRDFEIRRPDRDGQPFWVSLSGVPVFDDQGHFTGYRGVGHNITAQKLAEETL